MIKYPFEITLEELKYYVLHPLPEQFGIKSLYKFYGLNLEHKVDLGYAKQLFLEGYLHHSLPEKFNDPFEVKPSYDLPTDPLEFQKLIDYFLKLESPEKGSEQSYEEGVLLYANDPELMRQVIVEEFRKAYAKRTLCCFTSQKDIEHPHEILLWSHYADGCKGFCVEFDATKSPIDGAYKINYKEEYPKAVLPAPKNLWNNVPYLTKSNHWDYEEEFRLINHNNETIFLEDNGIKNVFLGAELCENEKMLGNKNRIIALIKEGPFNQAGIWKTKISDSSYSLEFTQIM